MLDIQTARVLLEKFRADYQHRASTTVATLKRGFDDSTAILAPPAPYRQRLCMTNSVERLDEEVSLRERVIRIFPTRESVARLLEALLMEQDETWTTSKRTSR
jgi:putative transposase